VDLLFGAMTLNAVIFTVLIFAVIIFLVARYRQGTPADRTRAPLHNNLVEAIWTIIPLLIALGLFGAATALFFHNIRVPAGAMEIQVVGKQWMWKMQHPSGRWENNELHVPVGRPIHLTLTSEDVIHSFYIPAFRLKQDAIPGTFTNMWFTATKPGRYHIFCAEFCGTDHSKMVGTVYVLEQAEYDNWLATGPGRQEAVAEGAYLFRHHGCSGCHGAGSSVRAPALEGIFGRPVPVQIPKPGVPLDQTPATTVIADMRYIHDSIVLPEQEVAAGFRPIMPTYKNRLTEEEILKLVAYIRSLAPAQGQPQPRQDHSSQLSPEDYKARTGFVPENLDSMNRVAGNAPPPAPGGRGRR
jgi:cytochrome c oxidase subunit 2